MPTIRINDTEIFYERRGAGYPCLLMHGGFGMDHTYFHPWLDPLGDIFELVSYDHRCNGRSGGPPIETMTFPQLSDDAAALSDTLGFERGAVLGHSAGGFLALHYALRYPERVSHLILVATAAAFDYAAEVGANAVREGATQQMLERLAAPPPVDDAAMGPAFRALMPLYFRNSTPEIAAAFNETHWRAAAYARNAEVFQAHDVVHHLDRLTMPVLMVAGANDFLCPPSEARRLHAGLGSCTLDVIEDCGHFPFIDRPDAFRSAVCRWWNAANASSGAAIRPAR